MKLLHIEVLEKYDDRNIFVGLVDREHIVDGKKGLWYVHTCSDTSFACHDLVLRNPERIEELKKHYGQFSVVLDDKVLFICKE